MKIPFWKLQAIGNDFPLFHASDLSGVDLSELAKKASDRQFGIGGDGILVMDGTALRMFNPDGTEDFCGNGLRIAARHAFDQGWVGRSFSLQHGGREIPSVVDENGSIRTTLGVADYTPAHVPVVADSELFDTEILPSLHGSVLTTGSTHTIVPVKELPTDEEIARLGPEIEYAPIFPERTSVIFTQEVAPNELNVRIWERGAGETLGCGTGSSAAAADYLRRTNGSGRVLVRNPGGEISISMDAWNAPITIEGTASQVYSGEFFF